MLIRLIVPGQKEHDREWPEKPDGFGDVKKFGQWINHCLGYGSRASYDFFKWNLRGAINTLWETGVVASPDFTLRKVEVVGLDYSCPRPDHQHTDCGEAAFCREFEEQKAKEAHPNYSHVTVAKVNGRWQPVLCSSCIVVTDEKLGLNMDAGGYETMRGAAEAAREMNRRRKAEVEEVKT